jgi:hypothetical protein
LEYLSAFAADFLSDWAWHTVNGAKGSMATARGQSVHSQRRVLELATFVLTSTFMRMGKAPHKFIAVRTSQSTWTACQA